METSSVDTSQRFSSHPYSSHHFSSHPTSSLISSLLSSHFISHISSYRLGLYCPQLSHNAHCPPLSHNADCPTLSHNAHCPPLSPNADTTSHPKYCSQILQGITHSLADTVDNPEYLIVDVVYQPQQKTKKRHAFDAYHNPWWKGTYLDFPFNPSGADSSLKLGTPSRGCCPSGKWL
jgi:hypothetical protein